MHSSIRTSAVVYLHMLHVELPETKSFEEKVEWRGIKYQTCTDQRLRESRTRIASNTERVSCGSH